MKFVLLMLAAVSLSAADLQINRFRAYPNQYAANWKDGVLSKSNDITRNLSCYSSFTLPADCGALQIRLNYKTSRNANAKLQLFFNKKGGRNGSAGCGSIRLPDQSDYAAWSHTFDVPAETHAVQMVFLLDGGSAELSLKQVAFDAIADTVKLSRKSFSGKPSEWNDAAKLDTFYVSAGGEASKYQTQVRLGCDEKNLYVGFVGQEPMVRLLKETVKTRDGRLWDDDTFELFLHDPKSDIGWQFIVNPVNTKFDGMLKQAQAGDPYKSHPWDGAWQSQVWKNASSWEAVMVIPWKTLNFASIPDKLHVNFARERKADNENSHWNAFIGSFNDVPKFGTIDFDKGLISRYRKIEVTNYLPKRTKTSGKELLLDVPGNYIAGAWTHGTYPGDYPDAIRKSTSAEAAKKRQKTFLTDRATHNMFGPLLPWSEGGVGKAELERYHKTYNQKFPFAIFGSAVHKRAREHYKAPYTFGTTGGCTDPASEAYLKATLDVIDSIATRYRYTLPMLSYIHGEDEPTNRIRQMFSRSRNPGIAKALDGYEAKLRRETGFGKYGLHDEYVQTDKDTPFRRIAFWRYWNQRFADYLAVTSERAKKAVPGVPYLGVNRNTCSGLCELDLASLTRHTQWFGCDPYPTSTKAFFGMSRALYHTGFSVKMVHDLANQSRTVVMPQAFIYHGGRPEPADMREWAGQALKNGAEVFIWYTMGPAVITMPTGYAEMLKLNRELTTMKKLPLPRETKSAILYSDYDRWGLDDKAAHAAYSVYALLGEHVKANFRFISPSGLARNIHSLDWIKVLYVPRMRFTDQATTKRLDSFVRNGGTLVVFDPTFWSFNIDGSSVPEREAYFGKLAKRPGAAELSYGRKTLPVAKTLHLEAESNTIESFDFATAKGRVVAAYSDGKPAAIERNIGKGKVILFGTQPFGCSDAALAPGGWTDFFTDRCREVNEKINLPVWDFVLPAK